MSKVTFMSVRLTTDVVSPSSGDPSPRNSAKRAMGSVTDSGVWSSPTHPSPCLAVRRKAPGDSPPTSTGG